MMRIFIAAGAILGGVAAFQFSEVIGMAFAIPLIKGIVIGALVGFAVWLVLRVFLETQLW
ncbi:hypothetical protein [Ascidiaceihabitans sp.]|uniref:hypothetical protein n=1 Tax=Ascidiaceihabitans sp. TaxID=1872644 RepID=UPI00329862A3